MIISARDTRIWKKTPSRTGVYMFLDTARKPIYIGKAVNLRLRIKQHFQDTSSPKERAIVKSTASIRLRETNSEFEALVLEANLVRKHMPKYNAALKDDKSPIYIVVTRGTYGKVRLKRRTELSAERFVFGPLSSARDGRLLLRKIRRVVPFCSEKSLTSKPCFYSHIGLCDPCPNETANQPDRSEAGKQKERYQENIRRVIRLLGGGGRRLISVLEKEMKEYADREEFEQAALLRDRIFYLEKLFSQNLILDGRLEDANFIADVRKRENRELAKELGIPRIGRVECYDISNLSFEKATASMVVFEGGVPLKEEYRRFRVRTRKKFDPAMLLEVLDRRMRHKEWQTADLMVIDGGTPQLLGAYPVLKERYPALPPMIGLAKRPDRVVLAEGLRTVRLDRESPALHYLQRVRDEAHRFARKYHLLLRRKSYSAF